MADVFQFEIDETNPDGSFEDDNDEVILDDVSNNLFSLSFSRLTSSV